VREDLAGDEFSRFAPAATRGFPNYFLRGYRHPRSSTDGFYIDIDTGELVLAAESHGH
jgi:hypothetical protein